MPENRRAMMQGNMVKFAARAAARNINFKFGNGSRESVVGFAQGALPESVDF